jgi:uncharacterized protein (TIGR02594 family)
MSAGELIIAEARKHLGTWEWAGEDHNPKVLAMYADSGHPEIRKDEVPWCAAFVGSVLARVGIRNTGSLLAKSYLKWGEEVPSLDMAEPGDILIFNRGSQSWQGHVGFLAGRSGGYVEVLGGNQNNQVNITKYLAREVIAIRRAHQPRTNKAASKTLQATVAGGAATATAGATAVSNLDGNAQVIVVAALAVIAVALVIVFRERIKKWAEGDK